MSSSAALKAIPFGSTMSLAAALRKFQVSGVELARSDLARVDRLHPALNALLVLVGGGTVPCRY